MMTGCTFSGSSMSMWSSPAKSWWSSTVSPFDITGEAGRERETGCNGSRFTVCIDVAGCFTGPPPIFFTTRLIRLMSVPNMAVASGVFIAGVVRLPREEIELPSFFFLAVFPPPLRFLFPFCSSMSDSSSLPSSPGESNAYTSSPAGCFFAAVTAGSSIGSSCR